jgi:ABC-type Na+ efflux pump permease subunit
VLAAGIALVFLGVVFGFFFPVMFVAAAAGLVLLILALVAGARRAKDASPGVEDPTPDRPE